MTNEELELAIQELKTRLAKLEEEKFTSEVVFSKDSFFKGRVGFFTATPKGQQPSIAAPVGGAVIDVEARSAINSLRTTLQSFGLIP